MKNTPFLIVLFFFCAASNATAVENHVRGIFDPFVSAVDSLLGISTADDSAPTSTLVQTPVSTEAKTTVAADPVSTSAPPETQAPAASTVLQTPPSTEVQTTPTPAPPPPPTQPNSTQPTPTEDTTATGAPLATIVNTFSSISTTHPIASTLSTPMKPLASITTSSGSHTTSADPLPGLASNAPAPSPSSTNSGGNVSKGGLAVAIIAALLLVAGIVYLVIRFNSVIQAKYAAWRESRTDQADEENIMAPLEKADDYEKPVFGKAVVVNIANTKPSKRRNSQESEQTLVPAKSPSCDSCHKQRKPRFSFQFFNPPFPTTPQTEKPVRRKPVPVPLNLAPTVEPVNPSIGVALGTPSKRTLPYPLSPKSWMGGRKRVSYFEDYSNLGRR